MVRTSKRLAEDVIKLLNEYGGFDGWWDEIDRATQKEITQDLADMLHKAVYEQ